MSKENKEEIVLGTAQITIKNASNKSKQIRALCDNGSQVNLITEDVIIKLGEKPLQSKISFIGIGGSKLGTSTGEVILKLKLKTSKTFLQVKFFVVKTITNYSPNSTKNCWSHISNKLADPKYNQPGKIEALLGVGVWIKVIESNILRSPDELSIAQQTKLGYVVFSMENDPYQLLNPYIGSITTQESTEELLNQIRKFWEIETLEYKKILSMEEQRCEQVFSQFHARDETGRYIVRIPFNDKLPQLGRSKYIALRQFFTMENKMKKDIEFGKQYRLFMSEYLSLGHMEKIFEDKEDGFYTPHHAVFSANKFRTVFNASAKTTTGITLNETQMVGEKLQRDLAFTVINFRRFKFGITADIEKMYRQILIHPNDRKYQKILWRDNEKEPVGVYQLNTVTYGHACAPHCAIRTLIQCARDHAHQFAIGANIVENCFYVDDLITGADSIKEIQQIREEVTSLLKLGGFNITKWKGNGDAADNLELKDPEVKSVLGLYWDIKADKFKFKININTMDQDTIWTKRKVLSRIGKLYDPNGFLGPIIINGKIIIQELWKDKLDWDQELSETLKEKWNKFNSDLANISQISLNRWFGTLNESQIQLHGFCDASELGYGAVVYTRVLNENGKYVISLIASKSRVAPLKVMTIPRLELCAANLLSDLIHKIQPMFKNQEIRTFNWSDSRITLCWMKKSPATLKTFVANRIMNIQEKSEEIKTTWKWISGKENPADLISRGTTTGELIKSKLWWHGPTWLQEDESKWPNENIQLEKTSEEIIQKEVKIIHLAEMNSTTELQKGKWFKYSNQNQKSFMLLDSYESWNKMKRVMATIIKATYLFKRNPEHKSGNVSEQELIEAEYYLVNQDQSRSFTKLLQSLQEGNKETITNTVIFWDKGTKTIRLDGRIQGDFLSKDEKYPMVLAKDGVLAKKIINDAHLKLGHGGNQLVMQYIRKKFWIIGARTLIKNILKKCPICFKHRMQTSEQMMAALPEYRTTPKRAFLRIGIDYAGPVILKTSTLRNSKLVKAYIAVFVCLVTRAVHLELVSDATTAAFIAAFRRMISRRGAVSVVVSDNGTNFVGANNYIKNIIETINDGKHTYQMESIFNLKWTFITPNAPHHGGIYEAAVKSVKHHLPRIIGNVSLTFEHYNTVLCQIEACLNSRPLTSLSDDPTTMNALTPGHFLIGEALIAMPDERNWTEVPTNRLNHYEEVQRIVQHFWERWRNEYLSTLINRSKWTRVNRNIRVGDLVVLKEDNLPPLKWKLARVTETFPGPDQLVRSVMIKVVVGYSKENNAIIAQFKRPITKLGLLMSVEEQNQF